MCNTWFRHDIWNRHPNGDNVTRNTHKEIGYPMEFTFRMTACFYFLLIPHLESKFVNNNAKLNIQSCADMANLEAQ